MGIFNKIKSAAQAKYDEKVSDMKFHKEYPQEWNERQVKRINAENSRKNKELEWSAKNARLEANIAKSQASARRYAPKDEGFGGFDMGGAGGSNGFDMSGGGFGGFDMGGSGGIDLGMGSPKKKHHGKKGKGGKKGDIHITIRK
jgi:hypothetical protein